MAKLFEPSSSQVLNLQQRVEIASRNGLPAVFEREDFVVLSWALGRAHGSLWEPTSVVDGWVMLISAGLETRGLVRLSREQLAPLTRLPADVLERMAAIVFKPRPEPPEKIK